MPASLRLLTAALLVSLAGCAPRGPQRLERTTLASAAMGRDMEVSVYLPPDWDGRTALPLIVFLHGGGDDAGTLDERGATEVFDRLIRAGSLPPFIMVAPEGEMGFWANWYDGTERYEDWVMQDVIPWVEQRYPLLPGRENRHLMGVSMGGAGTIFMALAHLDRFASASVISAPLYSDEQVLEMLDSFLWRSVFHADRVFGPADPEHVATKSLYGRVQRPEDLGGLSLLLGYGRGDSEMIRGTTLEYHDSLVDKGIPHQLLVFDGDHSWHSWNLVLPAVICHQLEREPRACDALSSSYFTLREFGPAPSSGAADRRRANLAE